MPSRIVFETDCHLARLPTPERVAALYLRLPDDDRYSRCVYHMV